MSKPVKKGLMYLRTELTRSRSTQPLENMITAFKASRNDLAGDRRPTVVPPQDLGEAAAGPPTVPVLSNIHEHRKDHRR